MILPGTTNVDFMPVNAGKTLRKWRDFGWQIVGVISPKLILDVL